MAEREPGRAIVVGAGIAGLSLAWALRRRGFGVDLYEQGPIPNPVSSSFDEHRVTRHAYGAMTGYARMMPAAFRVWDRLWAELGASHYEPCGMVYFLREGAEAWYEPTAASLDALGIGCREVPLGEVPARFPMVEPRGLVRVVETEGAGMLFPARILTGLTVLLARQGVRLHAYTKVDAVDPERATVTAEGRILGADVVAVTAGAWADRLAPELRALATPSRQAVLYLAPPPRLATAWAEAPVLAHLGDEGGNYTLPPRRGTRLKVGDHTFSLRGDPDEFRLATDADLERLRRAARLAYRDFDAYAELERKACFYTVEPRERFVVRPLGAKGWLVSACSGHGFKLQPLITEGVAQAIAGERPAADVPAWAAGD